MKFSTKTRYGLRAMVDMAKYYKGKPVLIKDIAKRQNISNSYLEQIMLSLKKAGLVESMSGAGGGFMLVKKPADIKAFNIVQALEGPISPVPCIQYKNICKRGKGCSARKLWVKVGQSIQNVLSSVTLKDLAEDGSKNLRNVIK